MTVDDKQGGPQDRDASLVERAAQKLGSTSPNEVSGEPLSTASLVERAVEHLGNQDLGGPIDDERPGDTRTAPLEPEPASSNGVHAIQENGVGSVELDFRRLESQGIVTPNNTRSRTTEEFRLIKRTVLANRWRGEVPNANLIMVTSAVPGEGKTFSAMNLSMSIASEKDLSVLLIDCDLTKPTISSRFGISAQRGLVDVLEDGKLDIADVIIRTNVEGLSVIPAGAPNPMNPELLASERMKNLLSDMATRYSNRIIGFRQLAGSGNDGTNGSSRAGWADHLRSRSSQDPKSCHKGGARVDQHRADDRACTEQGRGAVWLYAVWFLLLLLQVEVIAT